MTGPPGPAGTVVLVRHARTRPDPGRPAATWGLEPGAEPAVAELAAWLAGEGITRVVTSEEAKARETGRLLAAALGVPAGARPGLHEHDRRGAPFLTDEAFRDALAALFARPEARVFGRESAAAARRRYGEALRGALAAHPGETLAVVGHGTTMALFVAERNGLDAAGLWGTLAMPDALVLELPGFRLARRAPRRAG